MSTRPQSQLPAALGYHMPAEWEPHASTWLSWPHNKEDWPGKFEPLRWVYAEMIRNLARHERVDLIVNDEAWEKKARATLELANALSDNVVFHRWRTDRVWTRDSGCIFLCGSDTPARAPQKTTQSSSFVLGHRFRDGAKPARKEKTSDPDLVALHLQFNAWAKYPNYTHDEKIGARMAKAANARILQPFVTLANGECHRVVLEGGSIDVNGSGTLLTTEECLLSTTQQRNPPMDRVAYERMFSDYFGVESVIWLESGITGDDTHGHVDDITRFVAPAKVVTMVEPNPHNENHQSLRANLGRLKNARTTDGKRLEIVELPMPRPVIFEGRTLPASYANFYIANGCVLVPVFNDPNDRISLNTLANVFPDREIIPIYSGDLIWGFGALHCMTQQQPAARRP
jgi:agmatine deiminase